MSGRVLFVDDSGKPAARDSTRAVVIGGFSVAVANVPILSRRIVGAKGRYFPGRGHPTEWEIKAKRTITPNPWNRRKNRDFVAELVRIIGQLDCTVYTAVIDKTRMHHQMSLRTTMPLLLQGLVEHFAVECAYHNETGLVVSDWSSHNLDAHASGCVASFVASRRLPLHPSVYYANSLTTQAIQVADLVAGITRRVVEGDTRLYALGQDLANVRTLVAGSGATTHTGRTYTNWVSMF
ncbi:MAG: DUF3800 domain-containing protein [bacterium]|nr:DUF3800 domain-containing protein [bacterium]